MTAMTIATSHVRATVRAEAAILCDVAMKVGDQWIEPFAIAPWAGDESVAQGHMRWLGGEFFCLPFGGEALDKADARWFSATPDLPVHGPSGNDRWTVINVHADAVTFALRYPEDHAVEQIERTVRCDSDRAAIDISVSIFARRPVRLPAAFHPILRLPETPGRLVLQSAFAVGHSYPLALSAGLAVDEQFTDLSHVPTTTGTADLTGLPLGPAGEAAVQLMRASSPVVAEYRDEGFALTVDWDRVALPHVLLWLHDRGLDTSPWNGRFRGLGIEPCAAAFDAGVARATGENPFSAAGEITALLLTPDRPTTLWLRMSAAALHQ